MAKKIVKKKSGSAVRVAHKSARISKAVKKKTSKSAVKVTSRKRKAVDTGTTVKKTKPFQNASAAREPRKKISLGRPTISGDEKLYMLFHGDYHARQIFEFLNVHTVKELEAFRPDEIIARLTKPIHETVLRIREQLALRNRCLSGDEQFAVEYRSRVATTDPRDRPTSSV